MDGRSRRKGVEGAQPCPALTWAQREKITVVAAEGLEYLHEKADPRIIYCDARLHLTRILGTVGYHAPEL
ncbi:hypothetical protein J1N35_020887 [Gossypium stocksii]|uniref:Protein kinase domain-containing protein n=1 Tax=Gossypium stocksii TaxID=47602 RepID=A0A9D3ZZP0_9ROSI|nr:hypothetical protein J1N35_020887 [Gossypium stocksii]